MCVRAYPDALYGRYGVCPSDDASEKEHDPLFPVQKREKLQQLYNGSAESLVKFIGGYYHQDEKNEVLNMAFDKLVEWPVGCVRMMEAKGAHAFFELCGELVKSEPRPRHEILNMVLTLIGGEAA